MRLLLAILPVLPTNIGFVFVMLRCGLILLVVPLSLPHSAAARRLVDELDLKGVRPARVSTNQIGYVLTLVIGIWLLFHFGR